MRVGDEIEFSKFPELKENILVKILKLEKFNSFANLLDKYPEKLALSRFKSKNDWLNKVGEIYSVEEEKKYGALAIHIQLFK